MGAGCHTGRVVDPEESGARKAVDPKENGGPTLLKPAGPTALVSKMIPGMTKVGHKFAAQPSKEEKLLSKYTLGQSLGQGAFGVVYLCRKKGTKEDFAVKMIDKVEAPLAEIMQEADLLTKLAHPCIVKLHDVYKEKVFVCMVLELHRGGDMIDGMDKHWKCKGMIATSVVQNITKMMVQSVAWLHQNHYAHRDLKGDNFLMDRKQIEDPDCRIYLSDFGTVTEVKPRQRLSKQCGTRTYWAPELYDKNYSIAVDIWAIGVITFGLATGRFPFKNESECKTKSVQCCKQATREGEDFVISLLKRDESQRALAKHALEHKFLANIRSSAEAAVEAMHSEHVPELKEGGADVGVRERRRELVERLANAQNADPSQEIITGYTQIKGNFQVKDSHAERNVHFEWWAQKKAQEAKFFDHSVAQRVQDVNALSSSEGNVGIRRTLESYGIQISRFGEGQARPFNDLVNEVHCGQSRLMLDATQHKSIVRVVDVVLLRLSCGIGSNKRYLVNTSERDANRRDAATVDQLPGTKKFPHQSARDTIMRVVRDRLNLEDGKLIFDWARKECFEEDTMSKHYPGVRTVYRKEIFEGTVTATDAKVLKRVGLRGIFKSEPKFSHTCPERYLRTYHWLTEAECQTRKVTIRAPAAGDDISPLVHAPVTFPEEVLQSFLRDHCVDVSEFGKNGLRTLKEFSEELVKGEAQLVRKADGSITRIVDVVILKISRESGDVAVELKPTGAGRLPAVKRRPDENPFLAAKRVLSKVVKISENLVRMDQSNVMLIEEETMARAYPGVPTIYRRLIVPATVMEE